MCRLLVSGHSWTTGLPFSNSFMADFTICLFEEKMEKYFKVKSREGIKRLELKWFCC